MTRFQSLPAAGFAATAISYGPARMGFGLFVPEFRVAFDMSTSAVGFVSSLGFLGMFLGLLSAQALLVRKGPEVPVILGLVAATAGMGIVAAAPTLPVLALGVFLAASSAGFAWTPFNDAVNRNLPDPDRPDALSEISSGTSIGIAAAGAAALGLVLTGMPWRLCWTVFAVAGAVALVANRAALHTVERADPGPDHDWRGVLHGDAVPLFVIALVFGVVSAVYISFAADHMRSSGGVPGLPAAATPAVMFVFYGLFGLAGLLTNTAKTRIGLAWLVRALMLAGALSLCVLALAPAQWLGWWPRPACRGSM